MRAMLIVCIHAVLYTPVLSQDDIWDMTLAGGREISDIVLDGTTGDSLVYHTEGNSGAIPIALIERLRHGNSDQIAGMVAGAVTFGSVGAYFAFGYMDEDGHLLHEGKVGMTILSVLGGVALGGAFGDRFGYEEYVFTRRNAEEKIAAVDSIIYRLQQEEDVVSLKDGTVVRGILIRTIPDSSLTIRTADRSIFVFGMKDVAGVRKERASWRALEGRESGEQVRPVVTVLAGVAIPLGDYAERSGQSPGGAGVGVSTTVDVVYPLSEDFRWITSLSTAFNGAEGRTVGVPADAVVRLGSWFQVAPLTGIEAVTTVSERLKFGILAQVGCMFGTSPRVEGSAGTTTFRQPPSSATSFAFGGGARMMYNDRVSVGVRILHGKPEYNVNGIRVGSYTSDRAGQSTTSLALLVGYTL